MEDVASLFREHREYFTIYVVEQQFMAGEGWDFFKSYQGTPYYIDNDYAAKNFLSKIYKWIGPKIPAISVLLAIAFSDSSKLDISDIILTFSKLYVTQNHQAAGPDVIDPIIIQEGKVTVRNINHIVAIHKDSILAPAIIIILKDNDFKRAEKMLSGCPDGIYIKYIRNNGKNELKRVINTGAANIDEFITSFSQQCFSTYTNTSRSIWLGSGWEGNPVINKYAFRLLQFRSSLICDKKKMIVVPLNQCIKKLETDLRGSTNHHDRMLLESFL